MKNSDPYDCSRHITYHICELRMPRGEIHLKEFNRKAESEADEGCVQIYSAFATSFHLAQEGSTEETKWYEPDDIYGDILY